MTELIITANVRLHSNFSNVRLNVYVYAHVYDDMDSGAQEAKEIQCPTPWNWSPWDCLMWILRPKLWQAQQVLLSTERSLQLPENLF